jgi:hypothetical protein
MSSRGREGTKKDGGRSQKNSNFGGKAHFLPPGTDARYFKEKKNKVFFNSPEESAHGF